MEKQCIICGKLLGEGERVEVLVRATYHILKSKIAFALDKNDMEPISGTMAHVECVDDEENFDPPAPDLNSLEN
jgi:hypothetical protein